MLLPTAATPLWSAPDPSEVEDALEEILASGRYQTEIPAEPKLPDFDTPSIDFPILQILFWFVVGLIVIALILWLVSYLRRPTAEDDDPDDIEHTRPELSHAPLGDAAALAEAGRHDEAVHVLLLRTIEELRDSLAFQPSPALTSREIQRLAPLGDVPRRALGDLIEEVELSHFGGRPVSRADYDRCVERFHVFAQALGRNAPGKAPTEGGAS